MRFVRGRAGLRPWVHVVVAIAIVAVTVVGVLLWPGDQGPVALLLGWLSGVAAWAYLSERLG